MVVQGGILRTRPRSPLSQLRGVRFSRNVLWQFEQNLDRHTGLRFFLRPDCN